MSQKNTNLLAALMHTQQITERAHQYLPSPIRDILPLLGSHSEQDVLISAGLGVLSGCLPNVWMMYDSGYIAPNLYIFIVAPAASGKGKMSIARRFGKGIESALKSEHDLAQAKYKALLAAKQKSSGHEQGSERSSDFTFDAPISSISMLGAFDDGEADPREPFQRRIFLSGDISSSALTLFLSENEKSKGVAFGIIFETEADTVTKTEGQDWGSFSDSLRKAHAHEVISNNRVGAKREGEAREVKEPCLSVVLAGTPDQVARLFKSAENGLYSRFCFYGFVSDDPTTWRNMKPKPGSEKLDELLDNASANTVQIWKSLESRKSRLLFELTDYQWSLFNSRMGAVSGEFFDSRGFDGTSVIHRAGMHVMRVAMTVAAWSAFEKGVDLSSIDKLAISDRDFKACIHIALLYADHSATIMSGLPRSSAIPGLTEDEQAIYDGIAKSFGTDSLVELAKDNNFSVSTAKRWLQKWQKSGLIVRLRHGHYQKRGSSSEEVSPSGG